LGQPMHAQPQPSSEFGLVGNLQHAEQQRLTRSRRAGQSAYPVDSHKAESGFGSQLVAEEWIQLGEVQRRRHDLKIGTEPGLQYIHKATGFRIKISLQICPDQLSAEPPEAVPKLQLGTFVRGALSQGPGHEQKMTHWRFIAENSAGAGDTCGADARVPGQSHNVLMPDDSDESSKSRHPMQVSVRMVLVCVV
jgi:hypothetical protein